MEQKAVHTILEEDIYPNIDRFELLKNLAPVSKGGEDRGGYILCNCPSCGEKEAYLCNNKHVIYCNRKNKCGVQISIWDYVKEYNGFTTQGEVLKYLAESAGYKLPPLGSEQMKNYDKMLRRANLLNDAQKFFQKCLQDQEGQKTLQYLKEKRNYSDDVIHKMQLGHVLGYQKTVHHLNSLGYTTDDIEKELKHLKEHEGIHTVSIPLYDEKGRLKQVITRSIDDESKNKYLPLTTDAQTDLFVNIDRAYGNKDLIAVEGIFDALHLRAVGFDNVIGIRGSSITNAQLEVLKRMKVQRVFLCLDQDEAGRKGTLSSIKKLNEAGIETFIISLPEQFKDPDQLLSECKDGQSQFKILIDLAETCGTWLGRYIPQKYDLTKETGRRSAIYEVSECYKELNVLDKEALREASSKSLSIPEEHWKEVIDEIQKQKQCEQYNTSMAKYASDFKQLIDQGKTDEALALPIPHKSIDTFDFALLGIHTINDLQTSLAVTPTGLSTGYPGLDEYVTVPNGALTFIGGRPSHGKTTFMQNLMLKMIEQYPEKSFYFFSYEESWQQLQVKFINMLSQKIINRPEQNLEQIEAYLRLKNMSPDAQDNSIENGKALYTQYVNQKRLRIIDIPYNVQGLANIISAVSSKEDVGCIFIDYIQIIPNEEKKHFWNRQIEIQNTSSILRNTALKNLVPIILGVQLGRSGSGTSGMDRVRLDNLRECGDLEQDGKLILGLYNPAMEKDSEREYSSDEPVEITVTPMKNRGGTINKEVPLLFNRPISRITDSL